MSVFNFSRDCRNIFRHIKTPKQRGGCMPYDTGHLANMATQGRMFGANKFTITINTANNRSGAPYAIFLNEGSQAKLGRRGRHGLYFYPRTDKHVGFYDDVENTNSILGYTLNYFVKHYGATIEKKDE